MIKRAIQAMVLAIAGVIAFGAPAAAGTFDSGRYQLVCVPSGGAFGYGYIQARGWVQEFGKTGTNYFVIKAKWQQQDLDGGPWSLAWEDGTAKSTKFSEAVKDDGTSRTFDRKFRFSFHEEADLTDHWNRIRFTAEAWMAHKGFVLYRRTFHTADRGC